MRIYSTSTRPILLLITGFLFFIVLGAFLLKLPIAYHGQNLTWIKAFFTATSAVTVTGLNVVNTEDFSLLGQIVIMLLIQIGGLGFMTLAIATMISIGLKIGSNSQQIAQETLGEIPLNMVGSTAKAVIGFAFLFEAISTLLLTLAFYFQTGKSFISSFYEAIFLSISAFNNAGFALTSASLIPYNNSATILLIISVSIIVGGLGFTVLLDIKNNRYWNKFSLNTKLVLLATLIINLIGFILIFLLEHHNPNSLGQTSTKEQLLNSWFQAVTARTAGFNSIDLSQMSDAGSVVIMTLMFIGAGSFSTAGGIKVGTLVVLFLSTLAYIRRRESVTLWQSTITNEQIQRASSLFSISLSLIVFAVFILMLVEPNHPFLDILFEVTSALGTVGLSRGVTANLSPIGEFVLMLIMFIGRLGPLTIAYAIMFPKKDKLRYPNAKINIG